VSQKVLIIGLPSRNAATISSSRHARCCAFIADRNGRLADFLRDLLDKDLLGKDLLDATAGCGLAFRYGIFKANLQTTQIQ
jgi:hypothetical protein